LAVYSISVSRMCSCSPPPASLPCHHIFISPGFFSVILVLSSDFQRWHVLLENLVTCQGGPWSHRVICVVIKLLLLVDVAAVRSKARAAAYQSIRVRIAVEQQQQNHSSTSILFSRLLCYDDSSGCTICCGTLPASLLVDDSSSSSSSGL
jgi:hypothetical protein